MEGNKEEDKKIRGMINREHKGNIKEGGLLEMREIIANFAKREGSLIWLLTYLPIYALTTAKTSISFCNREGFCLLL